MSARQHDLVVAPEPDALALVGRRSRSLVARVGLSGRAPFVIVCAIFALTLIFGILLEQVVLAQSAFRLSELRKRLVSEETRHEELLLEAARLESPERIETYARDVLGMVEPMHVEYIVADVPAVNARRGRVAVTAPTRSPEEASAWGDVPPEAAP